MLHMDCDEIHKNIPYALICTTRESAVWETGKRRRAWAAHFSESERNACTALFKQAHQWYLVKGVPDTVTMSGRTFALWQKLGAFCASL